MAVDATVALGVGTALALGAAMVVLGPLWNGAGEADGATLPRRTSGPDQSATARAEGVSAVEALREIEFDRATGKLSDDDYATLKATYTRDALAEMRAESQPAIEPPMAVAAATTATEDRVEVALRAYRARRDGPHGCPAHGPRPESDAAFCSECGRFLAAHCASCGAACDAEGQRFCANCGASLALGASEEPAATV